MLGSQGPRERATGHGRLLENRLNVRYVHRAGDGSGRKGERKVRRASREIPHPGNDPLIDTLVGWLERPKQHVWVREGEQRE